ncbi:DUF397 domain-containing protein [Streptomyces sp. NPDC048111]|uniref:DUF397 domain-containing protein n=1 Tax=Streptomyces sp. NPDC048111 TaxID=3365500 RepID=UPI003722AFB0
MTTEPNPRWCTSSYSDNGGQCVEVATNLAHTHHIIPVRDSKNPDGPTLTLTPSAFTTLIALAKQDGGA